MANLMSIEPKSVSVAQFHSYMLSTIAPRPIAFVSTIDQQGQVNLSPFSFFNVFGSNPPILIFSPARRVRDNTIKHSLENVKEVGEVVVNMVNYAIVEQTSLASTEYEKGVNEFIKAGLTPVSSTKVAPPRVLESPAAYECKVKQIIETGHEGGAGNLVVCEVVLAHFQPHIFDEDGKVNPQKIDLVARMGYDFYCRASGEAVFEVPKPNVNKGMGIDQIPAHIRESHILTGNHLGRLGNSQQFPVQNEVEAYAQSEEIKRLLGQLDVTSEAFYEALHQQAKVLIEANEIQKAWMTLLQWRKK